MGEFQAVHVNFGEGVDTRTDPKAVVSAKLLKAQNVVFTSPGVLRKRQGYSFVTAFDSLGVPPRRMITHGSEVAVLTDDALYVYNGIFSALTNSKSAGLGGLAGVQRRGIIRDAERTITDVDMAIVGDVCVTAARLVSPTGGYGTPAQKITIIVSRVSTGEVISKLEPAPGGDQVPKCVAVGQYVWVLYLDSLGTTLRGLRLDTVSTGSIAEAALIAGLTGSFDVCPVSSTEFFLVYPVGANFVMTRRSAAFGSLGSASLGVTSTKTVAAYVESAAGPGYFAYKNNTDGKLYLQVINYPALSVSVAAQVLAAAYTAPGQVVIGRDSATSVRVMWDEVSVVPLPVVSHRTMTSAGALGAVGTQYQRCIASRPWVDAAGALRMLTAYPDGLQGTTFVSSYTRSTSGVFIGEHTDAIIARGVSGIGVCAGSVSSVVATAVSGVYLGALGTKQKITLSNFSYASTEQSGADHLVLDSGSTKRYCTAELGGLTYIAGGELLYYDGQNVAEVGFYAQPKAPTMSAAAGGATTAGDHQYVIVWEYTDRQGNVHRSAPSLPTTLTVGAGNQNISASFSPLSRSQRLLFATNAQAKVMGVPYATLAGSSSPFYRLKATSICRPTYLQDTPMDYVAQPFAAADATVSVAPTLYTTGGVLGNYPPPSTDVICVHKGRLWLASAEDGTLWFSKEYVVGEAPGFNDVLTFRLPTSDIPTAMASYDDKLIVWTATGIYAVFGEAPNDQGQGSSLQCQKLASDVGAVDWRGLAVTHLGGFFVSPKGIFLLTRGLEVVYVGADVEYWTRNYSACTGTVVTPDRHEVRFEFNTPIAPITTPTSQTLVLNFRAISEVSPFGKWSTFDRSAGLAKERDPVSYAVVGSTIYFIGSGGYMSRESSGFSDNGAWITVEIETANIYPLGRQGFMRCRSATLLGEYKGDHAAQMQIAYNDDPAFVESTIWRLTQIAALEREQVSHHLVRQKCAGVRALITLLQDGATVNEGAMLSGLTLEVQPKRGSFAKTMPQEARQ
jgi:hypothetical protein